MPSGCEIQLPRHGLLFIQMGMFFKEKAYFQCGDLVRIFIFLRTAYTACSAESNPDYCQPQ
jgi:hypothetical protein